MLTRFRPYSIVARKWIRIRRICARRREDEILAEMSGGRGRGCDAAGLYDSVFNGLLNKDGYKPVTEQMRDVMDQ